MEWRARIWTTIGTKGHEKHETPFAYLASFREFRDPKIRGPNLQLTTNKETPNLSLPLGSHSHHADQTFRSVQLEQAEIVSTEFYDCTFVRCRFVESVFRYCRFVNCVFQRCDLSLVQVPESTFSSTRFEDSHVIGVNWTMARWPAGSLGEPLVFLKSALNHCTFIGLDLSGIEIRDCVATDVDFREADLARADFSGTDLAQSLFAHTNLTEADLSRATNYHIDPAQNILTQARFSLPEAMSLLVNMDIVLVEDGP